MSMAAPPSISTPVMSIESMFVPLIRMLLQAELMPMGASWRSESSKRLYQQ